MNERKQEKDSDVGSTSDGSISGSAARAAHALRSHFSHEEDSQSGVGAAHGVLAGGSKSGGVVCRYCGFFIERSEDGEYECYSRFCDNICE